MTPSRGYDYANFIEDVHSVLLESFEKTLEARLSAGKGEGEDYVISYPSPSDLRGYGQVLKKRFREFNKWWVDYKKGVCERACPPYRPGMIFDTPDIWGLQRSSYQNPSLLRTLRSEKFLSKLLKSPVSGKL
jgi:hypothetical protein